MEFRILGPLEALDGGEPVALGGGKQRALLAVLLLNANRVVPVERFLDDLWGEDVPDTGRKMVQIYVSQLRKTLVDGAVRTRAPGYLIEVGDDELDLRRFERAVAEGRAALAGGDPATASVRLVEALALWRGPALAEFPEPFARPESARLEEGRLSALEDRIEADLALGRHADLIGELGALIQRHALRERMRGQQMLALYRAGRHAEALSAYQGFRRLLDEQLGIEPSQKLRELERHILQQDPSLEPVQPPAEAKPRRQVPTRVPLTRAGRLVVGREAELGRLRTYLDDALAGERRVVFVTGDPGQGKSTLVDAFLAATPAAPVRIARGQCVDQHGAGEAYMPVLEALGRICAEADGEDVAAILAERAPTWVTQMPWLVGPAELERLARLALGATTDRMLREVTEALEAISSLRPLVLVLEDLHWSDVSTVDLLSAIARRSDPARLLVLGTYRPADASTRSHPIHQVGRELWLRALAAEISLKALGESALREYVAARLPGIEVPEGLPRVLSARTGGNPLFAEKVVDSWIEQRKAVEDEPGWRFAVDESALVADVPETLRQLVEERLLMVSDDDLALLEAASVAGPEFSTALVAAACGRTTEDVEARCEQLARNLLFVAPSGEERWDDGTIASCYAFTHDLCGEVLYERVPAGRRARLHRGVGARLEEAYRDRAAEIATELASHFVRGHDLDRAVRYLKIAADTDLARRAYREAAGHLGTALDVLADVPDTPERALAEFELRIRLARALIGIAGWSSVDAEQALIRARELAEGLGRTQELTSALFMLATMHEVRGEYLHSESLLETSLALPGGPSGGLQLDSREVLACSLFHQGAFDRALGEAEEGLGIWDGRYVSPATAAYGDSPGVACHTWAALALWFLGRPDSARARAAEAVALARSEPLAVGHAFALGQAAIVGQLRREPAAVRDFAEAAIAAATDAGYALRLATGTILCGWALAAQGAAEEGIVDIRRGLDLARATGARMDDPYYLGLLAHAYAVADRGDDALATLDEALAAVRGSRTFFYEAELQRLRGEILAGRSQDEGERSLAESLAVARRQGARSLELRTATSLARLWQRRGEIAAAQELLASVYSSFDEGFEAPDLVEARALLEELGLPVSERPQGLQGAPRPRRLAAAPAREPVRYARSGQLNIAYQVTGSGPIDVVLVPGFVSHLDKDWEEPRHARFLDRLGSFSRLIRFDKRGTGLSDRPGGLPDIETRMDDVRAVMDAAGSERAVLFGYSEGGPMSVLFGATYPDRVAALVLYGAYAKRIRSDDYPWAQTEAERRAYAARIEQDWGSEADMHNMCPSADEAMARWWGERARAAASPGAARALIEMNSAIDVRDVLPAIHVPTLVIHRTLDPDSRVEEGRYIAERIPGAHFVELAGADHFVAVDPDQILDVVEPFVAEIAAGSPAVEGDRVLATILFTDVVGSTETATRLGDRAWAVLLARHDEAIRQALARFSGELVDTAGDGALALFDGPSRAIRCARAIQDSLRPLGLTLRAGVHTGEIERHRGDVRGIAVHLAARVAAEAGPGEVLVTATTRDLVAGSGLMFEDRGERRLKGIEEPRRLFAATG